MTQRRCLHPRCGGPAIFFGFACDWDWEILDEETRRKISDHFWGRDACAQRDYTLARRRGGGARTIGEALFVMRDRLHGDVEAQWRRADEHDDAEAAQYGEEPWR